MYLQFISRATKQRGRICNSMVGILFMSRGYNNLRETSNLLDEVKKKW